MSDVYGNGRALRYRVEGCAEKESVATKKPHCEEASDRIVIVGDAALTGLAAPSYTGLGPAFTATVPVGLFDRRGTIEKFNGVNYLVTHRVTAADGAVVTASKRVA